MSRQLRPVVVTIEVSVAYRGGPFPPTDRAIAKLARSLGGTSLGSSYTVRAEVVGVREQCYQFTATDKATTFARDVVALLP